MSEPVPGLRAVVVVPARDEEARVGGCVRALAAQVGVPAGAWEVVLVLDGCEDATAATARAAADGLVLHLVAGPERGVGFARGAGMAAAAALLRASGAPAGRRVIASTDADTVVAPDWLAGVLAAVDSGAEAVGGRITLDPEEAAALPAAVLDGRDQEAARRLAAVRAQTPEAEHHQFSGAALAVTLDAYDRVGGLPAVAGLEDEALERALRAAGLPIAYRADVRATTSARTASHVPRGLAQVLRTARWRAAQPTARMPLAGALAPGALVVRPAAGEARGDALERARRAAGPGVDVVVALGPGVDDADGAALVARLRADPALRLVRAAEPDPDPLAELVVRPALNLHAPELAVVRSPLTRSWAIRRALLDALPLPHGDAADLTVLLDTWLRHGLDAIGEQPVAAPAPEARPDPPLAAYALLAAVDARTRGAGGRSSAFADPSGVRRAGLDEHAPSVP